MSRGTSITVRATHPDSLGTAPMIYLEFNGDDPYLIELGDAVGLIETLEQGIQNSPQYPPGVILRLSTATYGIGVDGARRLVDALEKEIQAAKGYQPLGKS